MNGRLEIGFAPIVAVLFSLALACGALPLSARVVLAPPFADGMVLLRDREVPVWGRADPGEKVSVTFAGLTVVTTADGDGIWEVCLPPQAASKEGRTLTANEATIDDVLVGEVWLCAGQSNCDCPIWGANPHYRDAQGAAILQMTRKPFVRLVKTRQKFGCTPLSDFRAEWKKMTPESLFFGDADRLPSAVGFLFALQLADSLDIPIGLVDCSLGGSNIDAWTPRSGYATVSRLHDVAALPLFADEESLAESRTNGAYRTNPRLYFNCSQQPTVLWNGMVAAYAPMAIRGFLWYQGESNMSEWRRYCDKLHALYDGWRNEFRNEKLKMYFVQLPPSGNADIPVMQLQQARFESEERNAAMAIVNDVGSLTDIHPGDKRTVARRLALHALKRDYGFDRIVDNSPTLKAWQVKHGAFELTFSDTGGFYLQNEDWSDANGFEVAGADGIWRPGKILNLVDRHLVGKAYRFKGIVKGARLLVGSEDIDNPVKLRYLHSRPWHGNLYGETGLPVGAFLIDGQTGGAAGQEADGRGSGDRGLAEMKEWRNR